MRKSATDRSSGRWRKNGRVNCVLSMSHTIWFAFGMRYQPWPRINSEQCHQFDAFKNVADGAGMGFETRSKKNRMHATSLYLDLKPGKCFSGMLALFSIARMELSFVDKLLLLKSYLSCEGKYIEDDGSRKSDVFLEGKLKTLILAIGF